MAAAPISFLELILWAQAEADRIDVWDEVLRAEGRSLDRSLFRQRAVALKTVEILELVDKHRDAFKKVVREARAAEAKAAAIRAAATGSSAPSSEAPTTSR